MGWFRRRQPPHSDTKAGSGAHREPLPQQTQRELLDDWLRSLTILGDGKSLEETFDLIAQVNQPGTHRVRIHTPLPAEDAQALEETLAWYQAVRDRQAKINLGIEGLLIRWLSEATGQTWSQIVQRMAVTFNTATPPE